MPPSWVPSPLLPLNITPVPNTAANFSHCQCWHALPYKAFDRSWAGPRASIFVFPEPSQALGVQKSLTERFPNVRTNERMKQRFGGSLPGPPAPQVHKRQGILNHPHRPNPNWKMMSLFFPSWKNPSQPRTEVPESLRQSEPRVGPSGPSWGLGPGQGGRAGRSHIRERAALVPLCPPRPQPPPPGCWEHIHRLMDLSKGGRQLPARQPS